MTGTPPPPAVVRALAPRGCFVAAVLFLLAAGLLFAFPWGQLQRWTGLETAVFQVACGAFGLAWLATSVLAVVDLFRGRGRVFAILVLVVTGLSAVVSALFLTWFVGLLSRAR